MESDVVKIQREKPDWAASFGHGSPGGRRKLLRLSEGVRALCPNSAPADTVQSQCADEAVGVLAHTDEMIRRHRKLKL